MPCPAGLKLGKQEGRKNFRSCFPAFLIQFLGGLGGFIFTPPVWTSEPNQAARLFCLEEKKTPRRGLVHGIRGGEGEISAGRGVAGHGDPVGQGGRKVRAHQHGVNGVGDAVGDR